jgi:hypothetical protein
MMAEMGSTAGSGQKPVWNRYGKRVRMLIDCRSPGVAVPG